MVRKVIIKIILSNEIGLRLKSVDIYLAEGLANVALLNDSRVVITHDQPVEMR